jgi:Bacterial CdiA-CT RNAse A domain
MRPAPPASSPVPPRTYVVPKINGDPAAVQRLADAHRDLADAVSRAERLVAHVIADLSGSWYGIGHRGLRAPAEGFRRNAVMLVGALQGAADELDAYSRQLARSHHHHGFSLHKLLAVGAVVAVSAVAIVVTVGVAGVIEAAVATAAVEGATEAAGAAVAADAGAASGVDLSLTGIAAMRPLLAFVVPHLVQAEWATGAMAAYDELTIGRMRWRGLAETAGVAFVTAGVAAKATELVGDAGPVPLTGAARAAAPHVIEGTAWAGAAAVEDELVEHRLSAVDISETFVLAGGSTLARDALRERGWWPTEPDYRREAIVGALHRPGRITDPVLAREFADLRQTAREIEYAQVDLRLNEGPGHTLDRHVSKSAQYLLRRVRTSRIKAASTFWDEPSAREVVEHSLLANQDTVKRWIAAGSPGTLRLRVTVPYDVGFAINARGRVTFVRQAVVVLRRDHAGIVLVTSYPLARR